MSTDEGKFEIKVPLSQKEVKELFSGVWVPGPISLATTVSWKIGFTCVPAPTGDHGNDHGTGPAGPYPVGPYHVGARFVWPSWWDWVGW